MNPRIGFNATLIKFNGTEIFLDANILLYDFTAHPRFGASCHKLIEKTEIGQLRSFTSHWVISHQLISKYQLLSSDAIHVATCLAYGIKHIATNDKDFKRAKGITVWMP